jgi:TPP-dependent pyruvate/acetoin dehydrogenase alpha subunit
MSISETLSLHQAYKSMYLIRSVEEKIAAIYHTDKIKSPVHLSIGQEAPSVGVCAALELGDVVFGTYRGHALYLAKGGSLNRFIAELYGKNTGSSAGKAGSMHIGDLSVHMPTTSAIVASSIPNAVGYAFSEKSSNSSNIVVVFFGDGAMEEGVFYESLNVAALMKLPVLFVCENNLYAINTPFSKRIPKPNFCEKAEAFGLKSAKVLNNNVEEIYIQTLAFASELRSGSAPCFLEIETYRWLEHVGPKEDWDFGYRSKSEGDEWIAKDELKRIGAKLDNELRLRIEIECMEEVERAFKLADEDQFPGSEDLLKNIYG